MVQLPSFFTLAAHDVLKLKSRSVAVMVSRSPAASNRKFERMGMVVLRSTTPCVAVSSRSSSDLLTVISIVSPEVREAGPKDRAEQVGWRSGPGKRCAGPDFGAGS